jgi:hypothetical protein
VQIVAKKLPAGAILMAMVAAGIGGVIGTLIGLLIGSLLASSMHIPAREGESGYFIIFTGLIGLVIASPTAVLLTLYWRGLRRLWLLAGFIITFAAIFSVPARPLAFATWPNRICLMQTVPLRGWSLKSKRLMVSTCKCSPRLKLSSIPTAM